MKATKKASNLPPLQVEQVWKLKDGRLEIMKMGKLLAHYRLIVDDKRPGGTKMERVSVIQEYLEKNGAKLMKDEGPVKAAA